jgi:hypothetical protein
MRSSGLSSHTLPFTLSQTVGYGDPIRVYNTGLHRYDAVSARTVVFWNGQCLLVQSERDLG